MLVAGMPPHRHHLSVARVRNIRNHARRSRHLGRPYSLGALRACSSPHSIGERRRWPIPKSPSRAVSEYERRNALTSLRPSSSSAVHLVDVEKVDAATAPKLRTQVPGYEPEDGKTI